MPTLFASLLVLLAGSVAAAPAASHSKRKLALPKIEYASGEELKTRFQEFSTAAGENRTAGSAGDRRAHDWVLERARELGGWTVTEEPFKADVSFAENGYALQFVPFSKLNPKDPSYVKNKNAVDQLTGYARSLKDKTLSNIVLSKPGSDPRLADRPLVVTAHLDTISWRRMPFEVLTETKNPGALDNGAAVVALLAIARSLKDLKPRRPVELVFTDAAEAYFLGAYAHGGKLVAAGARADCLTLEMIGRDTIEKDVVTLYVRTAGQPGWEKELALAELTTQGFLAQRLGVKVLRNNADRAEHYALRRKLHSAVLVGVDWEYGFDDAHYHTSRDSTEVVDWPFAAKVGKGVAAALAALAATTP